VASSISSLQLRWIDQCAHALRKEWYLFMEMGIGRFFFTETGEVKTLQINI